MNKPKGSKREAEIQKRIIERYQAAGYIVVKLMLTNCNGIPDLMLLRDGRTIFVEVKRPGEVPRPLQQYRIEQLRQAGFEVRVETE
jgi:Holliday junction resolvase